MKHIDEDNLASSIAINHNIFNISSQEYIACSHELATVLILTPHLTRLTSSGFTLTPVRSFYIVENSS